mmetsp:Transcript_29236/g.49352  ORF Transcript_29236/g.49352 Transcript_29236/m.49352 type:complete len:470 (-) Transcript_29236:340-1749(-)
MFRLLKKCTHMGEGRLFRKVYKPLSSMSAINSQINNFPEYKLASEQEWKGQFDLALPNYLRVKDVMVSTTGGPYTDYSAVVALRLARLYCAMGKYDEALKSLGVIENYGDNHFKVHAHQLASICHLLEGADVHAALEAACEATTVCESLNSQSYASEDHHSLYSKNYTLQGLSCLLLGQVTSAEEHLQLAARWADNPTDKLVSLSNIGSLFCSMANFFSPTYDSSNHAFPSKEEAVVSRDLVRQTALIRDGLEYWNEAVTEANRVLKIQNTATEVHANSGESMEEVQSTQEKQVETISDQDADGAYTSAFVTILCNIAEAEIKLGDKTSAAQHLSSALEALNVHALHFPDNEFVHSPILGRCLYLTGCNHFHSGDFVLAEGLFKAAIGKFQMNSFCGVDNRHSYELMRAMETYGMLLQKWDKRESEGEKWIEQAEALRANMPTHCVYSSTSQQQEGRAYVSHLLLMIPR